MKYGYFDDTNREYVITRPDTPRPWSNYIGSAEFGGVITNHAAGFTFYKSAHQGRITRFLFNAPPRHWPGRYVYLRDMDSGDFWTNSWMPAVKPPDRFASTCRHGLGYTVILSDYADIRTETTYFIPRGAEYEVWKIAVTNAGTAPRRLRVFPFIEYQCNWNAGDDTNNIQYTQYLVKMRVEDGIIDHGSNVNMPEDPGHFENKDQARHTFMAVTGVRPTGFDTDLAVFLGPYGTYAAPEAVRNGACANSVAVGDMPCGALQVDLDLAPGERRIFAVVHGIGKAEEAGRRAREAMADEARIDAALAAVKADSAGLLERFSAETPDAAFTSMVNTWAPYNNMMTFRWARTASLVYAGERDGLGYRDAVQDLVGSATLVVEETRRRLELLLTGQFASGGAKPVVKPFAHRPGHETPPEHYRSDDALWLFNAVPAYVKETGDLAFFGKILPYADRGEASVLGHLRRAIEFNIERSGAHGLPCGLHADWNDCLKLGEKGESVFVAFQLRLALREYAGIAARVNKAGEAAWAKQELARLDAALSEHAWDGGWYLRAYRYDGLKFGSKENDEGFIFMNPQAWSVLSGHAEGERAARAMEAMHEHLATEHGIMLCTPPYVTTDPQICLARLMNPGSKENGGIFNHTQGWAVLAACELGLGDRAWDYLRSVLPASYNDRADIRQVEPYAVCQSTHSRFHPRCGGGRISWLSGSAVWNYVAMTQGILGIQPDYDGLRIDPCIPAAWDGFTVRRIFRGKPVECEVRNPRHVCKGVARMTLNGEAMPGNLVPATALGNENRVLCELG